MRYAPIFLALIIGLILFTIPVNAADTYMGFVSSYTSNNVQVFDPSSNSIQTSFGSGTGIRAVAVNPSGTYIYVADYAAHSIRVYNTNDYTLKYTIPLHAGSGNMMAFNSAGTRLYVPCESTDDVAVIDTTTNTVLNYINVGDVAYGIVHTPSNNKYYVTNFNSGTVSVIDGATNTVTATIAGLDASPVYIIANPAGTKLFVSCYGGTVNVIDTGTNTVTKKISVGAGASGLDINNDGTSLYVANKVANTVSKIDLSSETVTSTITVGTSPVTLALNKDDTSLYVANDGTSNITIINTASNTISSSIALAYKPYYIIIQKVAQEASNAAPMQVTFNVNLGGIVNVYNANVSVYDANTNVLIDSDPTDTAGNSIFWLIPGKRYDVSIDSDTVDLEISVQVQPNDQFYYIDLTTGEVVGSYQYSVLYGIHMVDLKFTKWLVLPVKNSTVTLSSNGSVIISGVTDDQGIVAFKVQNGRAYTINVINSTQNINKTIIRSLEGSSYQFDVTSLSFGGYFQNNPTNGTYNGGTGTGDPDEDIETSVTANKTSVAGTIICNYTDYSGSTSNINISIYTRNTTKLMLFGQFNIGLQPAGMQDLTHTEIINSNNGSYTLNIAHDPSGEDYLVIISSNYTTASGSTGTIHREYTVSYKGPTKAIPYFPATWYKYLAWGALIVISLVVGKYFVPEAGVVISTIASVFYTIGWFYEFGDAYMLLALSFCWVGSIALLFMKREKEGEA